MTDFGKSPPRGRRAVPRTQAPLIVELSVGTQKQSATLKEISRTGAKLGGVGAVAEGEEAALTIGDVQAIGNVVWCKGGECAIAFDIPISVREVKRVRSIADS
jgi:hypothetical protein